ncbi:MAG TPA: type 1 glutamine amidotransferase [Gemmatimonadales bacterium]|nr:type 1 glutamine amidotransferase [Gemmatimonadales bacterium]
MADLRSRPNVLVIQHVAPEGPGLIGRALEHAGLGVQIVRVDRGERIPESPGNAPGLVIMGGPMAVYDADRHPHIKAELRLIEAALDQETPILGICLGSQLLAAALGARVYRGARKEIGWYDVTLTAQAHDDPLWRGIPSPFPAFHWHGDVFELPSGAVSLASSALTEVQGFRFGAAAYGFLFHLEVDRGQVEEMGRAFSGELTSEGLALESLLRGADANLAAAGRIGETVFARWASLAAGISEG